MFQHANINGVLSNWTLTNLTDGTRMFSGNTSSSTRGAAINSSLAGLDLSGITNMNQIFYEATFNQDISGWNVGSVTNMYRMFYKSSFDQDISGWNVGAVTSCTDFSYSTPAGWVIGEKPDFATHGLCTPGY